MAPHTYISVCLERPDAPDGHVADNGMLDDCAFVRHHKHHESPLAMTMPSIKSLCESVQANCDIADARHAGTLTLCVYLLKMREYFRWEMGLDFEASLPNEALGQWIQEREQRWEELDGEPYRKVSIDGHDHDPFDTAGINRALLPEGYVYSAGLGLHRRPHFFMGRLLDTRGQGDCRIHEAHEECARDLGAPPAMTLEKTIFVRRESLRRMLWERVQEWRWDRRENALGRALACYPFEEDLAGALEAMAECETRTVVLHEIGEIEAGRELGEAWHELLLALPRGPVELGLRAVRDHWADCHVTLPALLEAGDPAPLLFYRASLTAMRRELFPCLVTAFDGWAAGRGKDDLRTAIEQGQTHWPAVAKRFLDIPQTGRDAQQLAAMLENAAL